LTVHDATFPLVRFTFALRVGALSDAESERGALAMLLPLMLRGTVRQGRRDFNAGLEALGSGMDAVVGHELAYLSGTCLKAHLPQTLSLVGEALCTPALDAAELKPLCAEAIQSLLNERDDDDAVADIFLRQALYPGHPLYHSSTGTIKTLKTLTPAAIARAYGQIRPERMIVALAGDVTGDEAQQWVGPIVERLSGPVQPLPALQPLPVAQEPTIVIVDKPERTQVQLRVARAGISGSHPDIDAFWLGVNAFGGTFTSPLTREVRDVRGWSYFAHADFRRRGLFASPVVLRSAPALADAVDCLALELDMFASLAAGEIDRESLQMAKDYLLGRVPFNQATAFDVVGPAVMLDILGQPAQQLWDLPQRLGAVNLDDVGQVMAKHLSNTHPVTVMVAPAHEVEDAVRARFPKARVRVVAFDDGIPFDARRHLDEQEQNEP
jgi:zinc protease